MELMSQYCCLMFVFRLTGPILFAVNISFTATVLLVFAGKKCCHLFPPTCKYYSLTVSPASRFIRHAGACWCFRQTQLALHRLVLDS